MSSEIPLATPDEAELVFSLLKRDLDASSEFDAVREAVGCAVRTTSNPRTLTAEVGLVYNLLLESVVDPEASGVDRNCVSRIILVLTVKLAYSHMFLMLFASTYRLFKVVSNISVLSPLLRWSVLH